MLLCVPTSCSNDSIQSEVNEEQIKYHTSLLSPCHACYNLGGVMHGACLPHRWKLEGTYLFIIDPLHATELVCLTRLTFTSPPTT